MLPWYAPVAAGFAAAVVLAGGLGLALTGRFGERLGPPPAIAKAPPRRAEGLRIVALGDSITAGTGDGRDGGYAARLAEALRRRGRQVTLANLAQPGDETGDLLRRIAAPEARRQIADADLLLVSAGGNDFSHTLRPRGGATPAEPDEALARARENLKRIVAALRAENREAPIRLVGLYNPFEVEPGEEPAVRAQLLAWNNAIDEATHPHGGALAIPILDLLAARPDRLARDRFHPGPRAHALLADRVLASLPDEDL
jgi:lysophospholipase L1-like esterase